jgi:prophage maintenance system killer protein
MNSDPTCVDGNKRTALGACLVHLQLNGYKPIPDGEHWEKLTLDVACGSLTRDEVHSAASDTVAVDMECRLLAAGDPARRPVWL